MTVWSELRQGCLSRDDAHCTAGTGLDPGAGGGHRRAGDGSHDLRAAAVREAAGGTSTAGGAGSIDSVRDDPTVSEADGGGRDAARVEEKARGAAGPCGGATACAGARRSLRNALARRLPRLWRAGPRVPRTPAEAVHRRHPGRPAGGSHRAHDCRLLVRSVQKRSRADGARRLAALAAGPSRGGALGLAALWFGEHALANSRRVQSSLAVDRDDGRSVRHVEPLAGNPLPLVRADSTRGARLRRAAWRRNELAGAGKNVVAVVVCQPRTHLLSDPSRTRRGGTAGGFYLGICRDAPHPFLL